MVPNGKEEGLKGEKHEGERLPVQSTLFGQLAAIRDEGFPDPRTVAASRAERCATAASSASVTCLECRRRAFPAREYEASRKEASPAAERGAASRSLVPPDLLSRGS